jgi:hypothetical protein
MLLRVLNTADSYFLHTNPTAVLSFAAPGQLWSEGACSCCRVYSQLSMAGRFEVYEAESNSKHFYMLFPVPCHAVLCFSGKLQSEGPQLPK